MFRRACQLAPSCTAAISKTQQACACLMRAEQQLHWLCRMSGLKGSMLAAGIVARPPGSAVGAAASQGAGGHFHCCSLARAQVQDDVHLASAVSTPALQLECQPLDPKPECCSFRGKCRWDRCCCAAWRAAGHPPMHEGACNSLWLPVHSTAPVLPEKQHALRYTGIRC